jgi:hypothetical protein
MSGNTTLCEAMEKVQIILDSHFNSQSLTAAAALEFIRRELAAECILRAMWETGYYPDRLLQADASASASAI